MTFNVIQLSNKQWNLSFNENLAWAKIRCCLTTMLEVKFLKVRFNVQHDISPFIINIIIKLKKRKTFCHTFWHGNLFHTATSSWIFLECKNWICYRKNNNHNVAKHSLVWDLIELDRSSRFFIFVWTFSVWLPNDKEWSLTTLKLSCWETRSCVVPVVGSYDCVQGLSLPVRVKTPSISCHLCLLSWGPKYLGAETSWPHCALSKFQTHKMYEKKSFCFTPQNLE